MIAFKRSKNDEEFSKVVNEKILSHYGEDEKVVKKAVASILENNDLIDINDEDIEDCIVVASVDGREKTIRMIEVGSHATKFPLDIKPNVNGHPNRREAQVAIFNALDKKIIASKEID